MTALRFLTGKMNQMTALRFQTGSGHQIPMEQETSKIVKQEYL